MVGYRDRQDAGRQLASRLLDHRNAPDVVVLALPRGGVPVAYEVASELHAPLDVLLVRKLGVPGQEELAFGAIASGGIRFINSDVVAALAISPETIAAVAREEAGELQRREQLYRDGRPPAGLSGRTVILVDDGLATGASMHAAVLAVRQHRPLRIIVAVPVGAPETCAELRKLADSVVCPLQPEPFRAVGLWYQDFPQISDDQVRTLLSRSGGSAPH
jgi:putative phosphoribosyl transferase